MPQHDQKLVVLEEQQGVGWFADPCYQVESVQQCPLCVDAHVPTT